MKIINYDTKSLIDLALIYYEKFNTSFPITQMKNCSEEELRKKILACIENNKIYNIENNNLIFKQNDNVDYKQIIESIIQSMNDIGYDYNIFIKETAKIVELRKSGKEFSFEEQLEALIVAQLSNHRWGDKTIKTNLSKIKDIFKNYNRDYLKSADSEMLAKKLIDINCGNASIYRQLNSLSNNILTLEKIEKDFGTLDNFITSHEPNTIANIFSDGKYKLKQIGKAFTFDYLKRIGIDTCKYDSQISRLFGNRRLTLCDKNRTTATQTRSIIKKICNITNYSEIEIDSILWQFCLPRGANICTELPNCQYCNLKSICNFNK